MAERRSLPERDTTLYQVEGLWLWLYSVGVRDLQYSCYHLFEFLQAMDKSTTANTE